MTPSIVEGLKLSPRKTIHSDSEPSLEEPASGNPISHSQIIDLWNRVKDSEEAAPRSLESLLRGCKVYVAPPPPKAEPVSFTLQITPGRQGANANHVTLQTAEYKALMARLRREEEARSYERMVNSPHVESFFERYPHASARAFAAVNKPTSYTDTGDDDGITYNDVHRQLLLIMNFLVSILGVAGVIWVAARWWSLPARLFLTMGGAAVVGVAEVAVYSIYVWKMGDAKQRQEAVSEVKEVIGTWVVGENDNSTDEKTTLVGESKDENAEGVRRRTALEKEADT